VTPTGPDAPARLAGTAWTAVSVDGQPVVAGSEPTAVFSAQEVSGTTGCNSYGGSYNLADGAISFGPIRSTLMACSGAVGEIEKKFNAALTGATSVAVDGDGHLVIDGTGGSIVFVGAPVLAPN
jgi:heat shock protein HslJ